MIGSRKVKKKMEVAEVSEIMSKFAVPLSLYLVPTNYEEEKEKFLDTYDYNPVFKYRRPDKKNKDVYEKLKDLQEITDVDPEISKFIIKTIQSKWTSAQILSAIGDDEKFPKMCFERFGLPKYWVFKRACMYLRGKFGDVQLVDSSEKLKNKILKFDEVVEVFNKTFEIMGLNDWTTEKSKAIISKGFRTASKSRRVMVDPDVEVSAEKLRKTLVHEIGTHALRSHNGFETGIEVFGKPTIIPEYLNDEEGLAMFNEEKFGVLRKKDVKRRAAHLYANYLGHSMSFREVFNAMRAIYPPRNSFDVVFRAKRGLSDTSKPGAYYKDSTYLVGFLKVRKRLANDKMSYRNMYAGKIPMDWLHMVEEGILQKPKVVPSEEMIEEIFKKTGLN